MKTCNNCQGFLNLSDKEDKGCTIINTTLNTSKKYRPDAFWIPFLENPDSENNCPEYNGPGETTRECIKDSYLYKMVESKKIDI